MIVVDTTVLVYAVGAPHPLAEPCRALVELVGQRKVIATTTVEAIQEFTHVRARRKGREDAAALADRYATLFAPLLTSGEEDLRDGLDVYLAHEELGAFDAVLAATARRAGTDAIVSADRGFADLDGPTVLDPGAEGFLEAVGAAG